MNVYEAIRTMLAVREYEDRRLPPEVVIRIVEAGRMTGSSRNRQEWDFVVVENRETLQRLGALAPTGSYIANAALAIAVVVPDAPVGYMDGGRVAQDMMLAGWGEGVGSNWVGNMNSHEVKALLGIPTDKLVLVVLPFGYPVAKLGKGKKRRKPLGEVAHRERYGTPFTG